MVVVDSGVWIDFFNGAPSPACMQLKTLLEEARTPVVAPDLIVFEVLRGFRHERQHRMAMRVFEQVRMPLNMDLASTERAANRYRRLREMGITIRNSIDVLVASHCIDKDLLLLQRDRDFLPFEQHFGLRLLQPLH
ncbi:PIN domain-containing protein [Roseateles sp. LKC17W]|uniref:PIN domain-containing protein n=1 Tax=Pelomonas margarita TaxID=3299031 RepID=A0ABW7FM23_9BURK